MHKRFLLGAALAALLPMTAHAADATPDAAQLKKLQAQFAPVEIKADVSKLPAEERAALAKMIEAGKIMDALFLRQTWAGNETMLLDLLHDHSALGQARLAYFLTMKGPWDRQDHFKPFIPGAPAVKPAGASFYPEDATKAEVEKWISSLPEAQQKDAKGFYTVVRRGPDGKLMLVPYAAEYQNELIEAATLLKEAAGLTKQPTLKTFLQKRAAAFLSNDYYDSELAWMSLDSTIDPTIGPYEVYEDDWFNYKAAFESFITIRDDAETAKLANMGSHLQDVENHLPFDKKYRNPHLGAAAPIRVVNEVYCSGDADHGVQTAAYNLPNDERVINEKGSKRVMLKNVQEVKFHTVLLPIAKVALTPDEQKKVDFDPFFTWILMHELMHGLGPHEITLNGKKTTARAELKELHAAIEEAKADITGLWAMQYLVDKGVLPKSMEKTMYATYLASAFRSIRFGVVEAHGRGQMMQMNYLMDHGGIVVTKDGRFEVNEKKMKKAVAGLTGELLTLEAKGDYAGAKALLEKMAVVRPPVQKVLDEMKDVPIDINPTFTTANELTAAMGSGS